MSRQGIDLGSQQIRRNVCRDRIYSYFHNWNMVMTDFPVMALWCLVIFCVPGPGPLSINVPQGQNCTVYLNRFKRDSYIELETGAYGDYNGLNINPSPEKESYYESSLGGTQVIKAIANASAPLGPPHSTRNGMLLCHYYETRKSKSLCRLFFL